ncbi:GAF domain-containing protein [Saccharospirillum sp. HFRX-1]|uniref:GAF domain-containing protein n=1 Tax=unclassified Saccharospirillum TaxID=2633430 RepID=UPI00371427D1
MHSETLYAQFHQQADQAIGVKLFTVMVVDNEAGLSRRAYTSHPEEYPTSGSKPLRKDDRWSQQVLVEQQCFIANSTAGFADVFPDHALINELGCESVINVAIVDGGEVIGTVNCLDVADHFDEARVATLLKLIDAQRADLIAAIRSASF